MATQTSFFGSRRPATEPYSAAPTIRIERRAYGKVSRDVVELTVALEALNRAELALEERLEQLDALKGRILETVPLLDGRVADERQNDDGAQAHTTLGQRIYALAAKSFRHALELLDRSPEAFTDHSVRVRWWLLRNVFRFLALQIDHCVFAGCDCPAEVWRPLHEHFRYLLMRGEDYLKVGAEPKAQKAAYAIEVEYKRLLLLGLITRFVPRAERRRAEADLGPRLRGWSIAAALHKPGAFGGGFNFFVVDVADDQPPRLHTDFLERDFTGWVFEPPEAFLDRIATTEASAPSGFAWCPSPT